MKTLSAGKFKDQCLRVMDRVAQTKDPVVVTKRGIPVVTVIPYTEQQPASRSLVGSILEEKGSPFQTGQKWDDDIP